MAKWLYHLEKQQHKNTCICLWNTNIVCTIATMYMKQFFLWISNYMSVHSKGLHLKFAIPKTVQKQGDRHPVSLNTNKDNNNNETKLTNNNTHSV